MGFRSAWLHLPNVAAAVLLLLAAPLPALAQAITVQVVVEGSGKPVVGALVSLKNRADEIVKRLLADASGRATIDAAPGRYRLRIDGIGFSGVTTDWIDLQAGPGTRLRITLTPRPLDLGDLVVTSKRSVDCQLGSEEGTIVARLWDEARKALLATQITSQRLPILEIATYQRDLDGKGRIRTERSDTNVGSSSKPFTTADPEVLHREGYVYSRPDGLWYNAPDADLLLSERFLDDHCFGVAEPAPGDPVNAVGLSFEPTPRRRVPDVAGVLWLDQTTAELDFLRYRYQNVDLPDEARNVGGIVRFGKLPNGGWIVREWAIRMPRVLQRPTTKGVRDTLVGYREAGGTAKLTSGATAADPRAISVTGRIVDSTSGAPLRGVRASIQAGAFSDTSDQTGRFRIRAPAPGHYAVTFSHPIFELAALDSLIRGAQLERGREDTVDVVVPLVSSAARVACVGMDNRSDLAVVLGSVVDSATGAPLPGATINVKLGTTRLVSGAVVSERGTEYETQTNAKGYFRACAPPPKDIVVTARTTGGKKATLTVPFPRSRLALIEIRVP